jgi:hypothetical protein
MNPTTATLTCTMCGHTFDPSGHAACGACPLQRGCQLVCCPACGFEMVNPDRSALARLAARFFKKEEKSRSIA